MGNQIFQKKVFFENTPENPHGYWVPVISVTKDRLSLDAIRVRTHFFFRAKCSRLKTASKVSTPSKTENQ